MVISRSEIENDLIEFVLGMFFECIYLLGGEFLRKPSEKFLQGVGGSFDDGTLVLVDFRNSENLAIGRGE